MRMYIQQNAYHEFVFANINAYSSLSSICEFILGPTRDVYYSDILTGLANTSEKFINAYAHFCSEISWFSNQVQSYVCKPPSHVFQDR
jgi:hypothetical protein